MDINEHVLNWLTILKKKPLMILHDNSKYKYLQIYIEGYVDGFSLFLNKNVRMEITSWFQKKINQKSSYYWTDHISFYYEGKNDEELKEILLNITEEYFLENPDWYKTANVQ